MKYEAAKISLPGNRQENQDRVEIISSPHAVLMIAVDGMGGHAEGARASEVTAATLQQSFGASAHPILDPQGFLTLALAQAHDRVVALGADIPLDNRPRATCAVCLVQDGNAYWGHVGDARVYQLRNGAVLERSRDHSHVELLLRDGLIEEHEIDNHPMRNYVECCLGGDDPIPDMSVSGRMRIAAGDVLLACTDGLWSGLGETSFAALTDESADLDAALTSLAAAAVMRNAPHSDNTSAVVLRFGG